MTGRELPSSEPAPRVEDESLDFYDRQDLGVLRRRLRKAGESCARERELYIECVQHFFEASASARQLCIYAPQQPARLGTSRAVQPRELACCSSMMSCGVKRGAWGWLTECAGC